VRGSNLSDKKTRSERRKKIRERATVTSHPPKKGKHKGAFREAADKKIPSGEKDWEGGGEQQRQNAKPR